MQSVIALGSNMGNSIEILRNAAAKIDAMPQSRILRYSSVYRTKPWGYAQQDDFLNAAVLVETRLGAAELYAELSRFEAEAGRERVIKNGPRTLDLDVILYGTEVSDDPALILPHPRAHERAFVLVPVREIAPDMLFANRGMTVSELARSLDEADLEGVMKTDLSIEPGARQHKEH